MMYRVVATILMICFLLTGCTGLLPMESNPDSQPSSESASSEIENTSSENPDVNSNSAEILGPDETGSSLEEFRQSAAASNTLVAVSYIGYYDSEQVDVYTYLQNAGFAEAYPFLSDLTEKETVGLNSQEWMVVVPLRDDVSISVREVLFDEGIPGEEIIRFTNGQPILLSGIFSGIIPDIMFIAENADGETVEFFPQISGNDGSLVCPEGVYDFTQYQLLEELLSKNVYSGTWFAQQMDGNGNMMAMTLSLRPDGMAEYYYGMPYSEIDEFYTGRWEIAPSDKLSLTLSGGPVESQKISVFDFKFYGQWMELVHTDGNPLLPGTEGGSSIFLPFDGFMIMNEWESEITAQDTYYYLGLFSNGGCNFSMFSNVDQSCIVSYDGWWSVDGGNLQLSLNRSEGVDPENPDQDFIYGIYEYFSGMNADDEEQLELAYISGTILTLGMEEDGSELFTAITYD